MDETTDNLYVSILDSEQEQTVVQQYIRLRELSIKERELNLIDCRITAFQECMLMTLPVESSLSEHQQGVSIWDDIDLGVMKAQLRKLMSELL